MAISWGAWRYSGGNGMRVGIDVSRTTVKTGSTSVTFTYKVYTQNQYRYNDSQTLSFGGNSGSNSVSFNNTSTGGAVHRATRTYTYNYPSNSYGSSPSTRTFSATLSGAYNGVTPSKSVSNAVPARPYAAPNPPSGVSASRVSDNQVTIAWTRNTTSQRPYTSIQIQRAECTTAWGNYTTIATATGGSTSYTDTTTQPNRVYRYRIRASNSVGSSSLVNAASDVYMTPGAPTGVTATLNPDGGSVSITWTPTNYTDAGISFRVARRPTPSSGWTQVATGLGPNTTSWADSSPLAGPAQYAVIAVHGSLSSQSGLSEFITAVVPPLAPTNLSPNGEARDFARTGWTISWRHRHGGDGAAQTAAQFEFRLRMPGDPNFGPWMPFDLPGPDQSFPWLGGNNDPELVEYRIRTQGVPSEGYGPWSDVATAIPSATPTATITEPGAVIGTLPIVAEWVYAQDDGVPQTQWEARLVNTDTSQLLQSLSGSDASGQAVFTVPLEDGTNVSVLVRVRSALGLWSDWDQLDSEINYVPPVTPTLEATYDPCTGSMVLDLSAEPPIDGLEDVIDHVDIQRRIGDGDWVTIVQDLYVNNDLPLFYEETFDAGDGGWSSRNHFNAWSPAAARVANNAPIPPGYSDGPDYLEVTWATPDPTKSGQNMLVTLTGLEIGQTYTTILQVYNPSTVGLRSEVYFNGGNVPIPVGPGWQTIRGQFTATAGGRDFGLFTTSPVAGEKVYIDKVRVYVGETEDYPENIFVPTTVVDPIPQTAGSNEYRAIAYAPNGVVSYSAIVVEPGTNRTGGHFWVFLAYGPGFSQVLRFRGDPQLSASTSRRRTARELLRSRPSSLPLGLLGKATGRQIQAAGRIKYDPLCRVEDECEYDSSRDEWEQASWDSEVVCYRDYTGRRIFGILDESVDTSEVRPGISDISFSVIETAYEERPGTLGVAGGDE